MNARERFAAVMHYQPRDRSPIMDFGFWDETLVIWQDQGYPAGPTPISSLAWIRNGPCVGGLSTCGPNSR